MDECESELERSVPLHSGRRRPSPRLSSPPPHCTHQGSPSASFSPLALVLALSLRRWPWSRRSNDDDRVRVDRPPVTATESVLPPSRPSVFALRSGSELIILLAPVLFFSVCHCLRSPSSPEQQVPATARRMDDEDVSSSRPLSSLPGSSSLRASSSRASTRTDSQGDP